MTAVSKNVYTDKLGPIVNKCNNAYHKIIKMKPTDVMSGMYIEYGAEQNDRCFQRK